MQKYENVSLKLKLNREHRMSDSLYLKIHHKYIYRIITPLINYNKKILKSKLFNDLNHY